VKVSDLQIKSLEMQREILAMNKDLSRIEKKIDGLVEEVHQVLKIVRVVERELEKGK
jgi:cell division protein FtsL